MSLKYFYLKISKNDAESQVKLMIYLHTNKERGVSSPTHYSLLITLCNWFWKRNCNSCMHVTCLNIHSSASKISYMFPHCIKCCVCHPGGSLQECLMLQCGLKVLFFHCKWSKSTQNSRWAGSERPREKSPPTCLSSSVQWKRKQFTHTHTRRHSCVVTAFTLTYMRACLAVRSSVSAVYNMLLIITVHSQNSFSYISITECVNLTLPTHSVPSLGWNSPDPVDVYPETHVQ